MTRYLVSRANALMFGVLIAIVLLVGGITWQSFSAGRSALIWSQHTYDVLGAIKDLGLAVRDAETGQRGYLLTGNDDYLAPYNDDLGRATFLAGELDRLTADNPAEQERLRALAPVLQHKLEELAQTVQLRRDVGFDAALRIVRTDLGREYMKQITAILAAMTSDEQRLLVQRLAETDQRGAWVRWLVGGGTILSALTLLWAARLLNQAWAHSNRTEAEQRTLALRLRTSLDSLSQGIAVFGADRQLTNWNDCFQALLALPKAMVRPGMPYAACAEHTAQAGVAVLETEEQVSQGRRTPGAPVTYECSGANGTQLELRRTPMPDGGFVLTVADMTKRAQAEGVLRESQKMQAVGQLTGGIAHDFNNLLTVIQGNLELAGDQATGQPALQTVLDQAAWAAQRGATLTAQLLSFARKQPLAPAAIDLAAAMPNLVPLLRRTLGEHIDIRYVETAGLWAAMADPAQLETALLNLALNARDAMPDGGRLTIELANMVLDEEYARHHGEVAAGDYAMLAVSDTGQGMRPDVMARVFEPFFTTKADAKGTGLGLAMVFGFVKQSGGHVKVYSELGEGTTIRLYLPRAVGVTVSAGQRSTAPIELPRGSATVLVVEDDAAVRKIAVTMLRGLGYRVLEAADGEQCLHVFGANAADVDLLLTDVVLPGAMRGRDVAERVTAIRPEVKVLYMSGYAENSIVHNGRLDEGVQLIGKPFRREQLARKVAEVIGGATGPVMIAASTVPVRDTNVVELPLRRGA